MTTRSHPPVWVVERWLGSSRKALGHYACPGRCEFQVTGVLRVIRRVDGLGEQVAQACAEALINEKSHDANSGISR